MDKSKQIFLKLIFISFVGIFISTILIFQHIDAVYGFTPGPSSCVISESFDCDKVAQSAYSMLFGIIPVAAIGLFYFLALIVTTVRGIQLVKSSEDKKEDDSDLALSKVKNIIRFLTSTSLISTLIFAGISFFIIKTICIYCSILYVVNILLWFLALPLRKSLVGDVFVGAKEFAVAAIFKPFGESNGSLGSLYGLSIILCLLLSLSIEGFVAWNLYVDEASKYKIGDIVQSSKAQLIVNKDIANEGYTKWKESPVMEDLVSDDEVWMGDQNAEVIIVKFSDFQCPACKKMHFIIEELVGDFGKNILFIDKQFPLSSKCNTAIQGDFHKSACDMSKAALCAQRQGSYWAASDYLYTLPLVTESSIAKTASWIGINEDAFKSCMAQDGYPEKITTDSELGKKLKIRGTPAIYVNGKHLSDGLPGSLVVTLRKLLKTEG